MDAIDNPTYFSCDTDDQNNYLSLRIPSDARNRLPNNSCSSRRGVSTLQSRRKVKILSRSNSEDTQLLVLGKPRPSDLPPTIYTTKHERHNSVGNVNTNDLLHQDMVHCGGVANEREGNDLFSNNKSNVQYYNMATLPKAHASERRHSIGSFRRSDRSFPLPLESDTRTNEASSRRKLKRIIAEKVGNKMVEAELDILLVSCGENELSTKWVDYLMVCLQKQDNAMNRKKSPLKLQNAKLEDILPSVPGSKASRKWPSAKLQILIVCPQFLEKIKTTPLQGNPLRKICPDRVLALMLRVQDQDDDERIKSVFPNYEQWRKMNVKDQDFSSVCDFLGVAMDILNRTWQIEEIIHTKHQELTHVSIFPKKVKVGYDKLSLIFEEPLTVEDKVKIFLEKNGKRVEITSVKKRNPYTLQFTMPGYCLQVSMLVSVYIEKNGKLLGKRMVKCESQLRELEQLIRLLDNPISFLSQSFGLNTNDREQLDSFLLGVFLKNVPPNFNLLNPGIVINQNYICSEEFPTLLHFAAKYGFEKLSCQLIESPGGEYACQIRNCINMTPAEMAEKANYVRLANALKGHMQMTELSTMYNYLKGMTAEHVKRYTENNYLQPRPVDDTYLVAPTARPVHQYITPIPDPEDMQPCQHFYENFKPGSISLSTVSTPTSPTTSTSFAPFGIENYETPRNGRPCTPRTPPTPHSPTDRKFEEYLEMNPCGSESSTFGSANSFSASNADFRENFYGLDRSTDVYKSDSVFSEAHSSSSKCDSAKHLPNQDKLTPHDELLEIINDFKNNVFTIKEVEKLVQDWQNRSDVQQSFKEREEQLNKMREEYDKIQRHMKEEMKRPTPFEKFRKFFSWGKPKHSDCGDGASITSDVSCSQMRAASSISLHSISSGSSAANSISSGSYVTTDGCSRKCVERIDRKRVGIYSEISQPSKYLEGGGVNSDFSEYVQPDCMVCNNRKRLSSCSGSVMNDTIHECVEFDQGEKAVVAHDQVRTPEKPESHKFKIFARKDKKSGEKFKTSSLKAESKHKRKGGSKNKVKSAENLTYNGGEDSVEGSSGAQRSSERSGAPRSDGSPPAAVPAAGPSYEQTVELAGRDPAPTRGTPPRTRQNDEEIASDGITFRFEKMEENVGGATASASDCGSANNSRKSSSLNLSSLSLNSNCTVDENGEIEEEKVSLELKITEEGETETETVPPAAVIDQQNYIINICKLPDYVNVNLKNTSELTRPRCKYATVSS